MRLIAVSMTAAASLAEAAPAHHSVASFDLETTITLEGEVTEFRWTNPHSVILLDVEADGATASWRVELSNPVKLFRQGWRREDVAAGDRVTLVVHPMRDERGGALLQAMLADGTERVDTPLPLASR